MNEVKDNFVLRRQMRSAVLKADIEGDSERYDSLIVSRSEEMGV